MEPDEGLGFLALLDQTDETIAALRSENAALLRILGQENPAASHEG